MLLSEVITGAFKKRYRWGIILTKKSRLFKKNGISILKGFLKASIFNRTFLSRLTIEGHFKFNCS
jgi:hypothetical protein